MKRPGKADKRKTVCAAYYQATKDDPAKMEQRLRWLKEHPDEVRIMQQRSTKKYREKMRAIVDEAKATPCARCGGEFSSRVMDFHHRVPADKSFNICSFVSRSGKATHGQSRIEALLAEIDKCDVLCSNCHRMEH